MTASSPKNRINNGVRRFRTTEKLDYRCNWQNTNGRKQWRTRFRSKICRKIEWLKTWKPIRIAMPPGSGTLVTGGLSITVQSSSSSGHSEWDRRKARGSGKKSTKREEINVRLSFRWVFERGSVSDLARSGPIDARTPAFLSSRLSDSARSRFICIFTQISMSFTFWGHIQMPL
jgi:hypothetical protein